MATIQKSWGFTIAELVIVVIILAIIALVTSIKLPGTSINLDTQVAQLAYDVRYTQNLSMARNQHYRLIVTPPSSYAVQDGSGNTQYTITLATGMSFSAPFTIIFNSKGIPYSNDSTPLASTATITITYNGQTNSVTITPVTGRVTP